MVGKGHEDQFRPPSLNGGCRLGKATFAGMSGKEEDAPIPDIPVHIPERGGSTHLRLSCPRHRLVVSPKKRSFA
jgi:hypothetical protein